MSYLIGEKISISKTLYIFILFLILACKNEKKKSNKNINTDNISENCYLSPDNSGTKIIHFIITRFLIEFYKAYGFPKKMYNEDYIPNGIRVMKKYLSIF